MICCLRCKGGSVEDRLFKKTSPYSKFEFSFPVTLCLPFKELFFSVFSNWESAEQVFWSEELSSLPYKNKNKSLTLSFGGGKIQICCIARSFYKAVLPVGHLLSSLGICESTAAIHSGFFQRILE